MFFIEHINKDKQINIRPFKKNRLFQATGVDVHYKGKMGPKETIYRLRRGIVHVYLFCIHICNAWPCKSTTDTTTTT
jgi:hypothetical protein